MMNSIPLRQVLIAMTACLLLIGAGAAREAGSAERLLVRIAFDMEPGRLDDAVARLRDIAAPAPLTFVAERKKGLLARTNRAGYERLLADPDLYSVRLARGTAPAVEEKAPGDFVTYEIRLRAADISAEAVPAGALSTTNYTATVTARRAGEAGAPAANDAGPGTLIVKALDDAGAEIFRTVVPDPRLVRYEAVDAAGRFTGRTDFYRTDATIRADVPADPAIAALEIAAPSRRVTSPIAEVDVR